MSTLDNSLPEEEKGDAKRNPGLSKLNMILTTAAIFYGNIAYGCAMTSFSPALTDFKRKFDTDTSTISVVFTVTTVCYMIGALSCSVIYDLMNRQLVVVLLFAGMSGSMFVAPHVPSLGIFYVVGGFLGYCMGCYDTAQVVWIIEMYQSKSGPFIQAQHFCYAIGSVLSPLLMTPFLTKEEEEEDDGTTTTTDSSEEEENKRLFVPFTIFGGLCAITMIAQALLFIFMRYKPPPPEMTEDKVETKTEGSGNWFQRQWPGWPVARLVILSMLFIGFDQGMEVATVGLFPTFGQKSKLSLSEAESASTLTGYTTAFAVARGVAIPLSLVVLPEYILSANIALSLLGNILLIGWGNTNLTILWISGILYGLGFSSLMPSFCAYMERYLIFTNTIGSMMIISGSLVASCYPLIVGRLIDDHPLVLTYPIFFSCAVMICVFAISYWMTLRKKKNVP